MNEFGQTILVIANIMMGEAQILHNDEAMMGVGHIFINRLLDEEHRFGYFAVDVATDFHGYDKTRVPSDVVIELSKQLIANRMVLGHWSDPTQGCLYVYSHQDLLNIYGEDASCVMPLADWQSNYRRVKDEFYRLYGFKELPSKSLFNAGPLCDPRFEG